MKLKYLLVASSLFFISCKKDAVIITPYGVSISDGSVIEGNSGDNKVIEFDITLDAAVFGSDNVTVEIITTDGTGKTGEDFVTLGRPIITPFSVGERTKKIQIEIIEDGTKEENEEFSVVINSVSSNAKIVDGTGKGTILNDD